MPIYVKVILGKLKLVVPVPEGADLTVGKFGDTIAARFKIDRVKEITTADGFLLNQNDLVSHVLRDEQVLIAMDYAGWMLSYAKDLIRPVLYLSSRNYETNQPRYAEVGWCSALSKLWVRVGTTKPELLELYSPDELKDWAKPGKRLVIRNGEEKEGFATVEFDVGVDGVVKGIECVVKSETDVQAKIHRIPLTVNADSVSFGSEEILQSAYVISDKKYTLPEEIKATKEIVLAEGKTIPVPVVKSTGHYALTLEQKSHVEVTQGYASDGKFDQGFNAAFELLNMGGEKIVIKSFNAEWRLKDGNWADVTPRVGHRDSEYRYSWSQDNTSYAVEPKAPFQIALSIVLPVTGRQGPNRRPHSSLDTLEMKFILTDVAGAKCEIVTKVEKELVPLSLPTQETRRTYNRADNKMMYGWSQVDDTEVESRSYVEFWREKSTYDPYPISFYVYCNETSSQTFSLEELARVAYDASKEKKSEYLITNISKENPEGTSVQVSALVDTEARFVYGFKSVLSVPGGVNTTTQSFLLPYVVA